MDRSDRQELDFLREPVIEPVPETLYVACVLTIEQRQTILRGLSLARSYLRQVRLNVPMKEEERQEVWNQIRELDRISSRLYDYPAYSTSLVALENAAALLRVPWEGETKA